MLHVTLDFENGLKIDALVESGAYVSAIPQSELDQIKQQALANVFKIDDSPSFHIQAAKGQLEKPKAKTTRKFEIGDHMFATYIWSKLTICQAQYRVALRERQ